jgi:predicted metal-dependent phosphoesterase TrpH
MNKKVDYHIHTVVSDGIMEPMEIIREAQTLGLAEISITDHDAVGAYKNFNLDLFSEAEACGVRLIAGTELDCHYQEAEIHVLGYHIDINNLALVNHLQQTQTQRKKRIAELVDAINLNLKEKIIDPTKIFIEYRDTFMKPHIINPLLESGRFETYRQAAAWLKNTVRVKTDVPKYPISDIIRLILQAGGMAILAHPAYYHKESGIDLRKMCAELKPLGLAGIELDYPYLGSSPHFTAESEVTKVLKELGQLAAEFSFVTTRGSDAHRVEQLRAFNSPK